jgi:hypothetical protein
MPNWFGGLLARLKALLILTVGLIRCRAFVEIVGIEDERIMVSYAFRT